MDLKEKSICCTIIHQDVINKVSKSMPDEETLTGLAELFKVLGDGTRIKIVSALISNKMCVCDIAHLLNMTHSAVSHQLRVLKQTRLVKSHKSGKTVYYSLDDEHIELIYDMGIRHLEEK